jgi:hypothetical protein
MCLLYSKISLNILDSLETVSPIWKRYWCASTLGREMEIKNEREIKTIYEESRKGYDPFLFIIVRLEGRNRQFTYFYYYLFVFHIN